MRAKVMKCQETAEGSRIFSLEFFLKTPMKVNPGQFITLEPLNPLSVMPRPFSVCFAPLIIGDRIRVLIKVVGPNTAAYAKLQPGEEIEIAGPKGNPIPLDQEVESYILVAGGIGAAPLIFLAEKLRKKNKTVTFLLGARRQNQIFGVEKLGAIGCHLQTITQEGEENGTKTGKATDLLKEALADDHGKSTVIACGPMAMLNEVAKMTAKSGNRCLVLLEERMACGGVGSCKSDPVFGKDRTVKHVCKDGPAFDASWIDWEELMRPYEATPLLTTRRQGSKGQAEDPLKTILTSPDGERTLELKYPIVPNSGCVGIEALEDGSVPIHCAGAVITKGVTLKPKSGNKLPRTCEVPGGLINAIGLENPGLKIFKRNELPRWQSLGLPVIVNIAGSTVEEYAIISGELADTDAAAFEINISCPNLKSGGTAFGINSHHAFEVVNAVREAAPNKFRIVKLTPGAGNQGIVEVARAVVEAGADALSLTNTFLALAINVYSRKAKLGNGGGGLSGPAIRTIANRMIYDVFRDNPGVGVIGYGGVEDGEDAMEKILCGASVIGVGTALFANTNAMSDIHDFLLEMVSYHNVGHIRDLVGKGGL